MWKTLTREEFLKRAIDKHGGKYDYTNTVYTGNRNQIEVNCPKHGLFTQRGESHLKGGGCQRCGREADRHPNKTNSEQFIKKAKEIHGDESYDYHLVNYTTSKNKVCIICKIHGEYSQIAQSHLQGKGCKKCADIKRHESIRSNTEEFEYKSKSVHGNKYDYSICNYEHSTKKVDILCKIHGKFSASPSAHLSGSGCRKCSKTAIKTTEGFIAEIENKFGKGLYDYGKVQYKGNKIKVCITCHTHGDFFKKPNTISKYTYDEHYRICPKCSKHNINSAWTREAFSKICNNLEATFYAIRMFLVEESFIKIGITSRTVMERYNRKDSPYYYEILKEVKGEAGSIFDIEKYNKKNLKEYKYTPLINFPGKTECLTLSALDKIKFELD